MTTTATTTFYMHKLSDPLGNLECTTHHQPPRHNKAGSNEGQINGDGWEPVAILAQGSVPMVPRLAAGTSPTLDAREYGEFAC